MERSECWISIWAHLRSVLATQCGAGGSLETRKRTFGQVARRGDRANVAHSLRRITESTKVNSHRFVRRLVLFYKPALPTTGGPSSTYTYALNCGLISDAAGVSRER